MVLPLIPIALAGIIGAGSAGIIGGAVGGAKKEEHIVYSPTTTTQITQGAKVYAPVQTYSPQTGYSYIGATYIIDSPGAMSKKEAQMALDQETGVAPIIDVPTIPSQEAEGGGGLTEGTNMLWIAAIAAVGVVGYGLVSKGGK